MIGQQYQYHTVNPRTLQSPYYLAFPSKLLPFIGITYQLFALQLDLIISTSLKRIITLQFKLHPKIQLNK